MPTTGGTAEREAEQAAYIRTSDTWYALGEAGGNLGPVSLYTGQDDLPLCSSTDPNDYFVLWYKSGACNATGCAKDAVAILQKWLADTLKRPPARQVRRIPTDPAAALQATLRPLPGSSNAISQALVQAFAGAVAQQIVK